MELSVKVVVPGFFVVIGVSLDCGKTKKKKKEVIITKGVLMAEITINLSFANHDITFTMNNFSLIFVYLFIFIHNLLSLIIHSLI